MNEWMNTIHISLSNSNSTTRIFLFWRKICCGPFPCYQTVCHFQEDFLCWCLLYLFSRYVLIVYGWTLSSYINLCIICSFWCAFIMDQFTGLILQQKALMVSFPLMMLHDNKICIINQLIICCFRSGQWKWGRRWPSERWVGQVLDIHRLSSSLVWQIVEKQR